MDIKYIKKPFFDPSGIELTKEVTNPDTIDFIHKEMDSIRMHAVETTDAFIFETILPFCQGVAPDLMTISKQELIEAIQLLRLRKLGLDKFGVDLGYDLNNATQMSYQLSASYDRGFNDGREQMRELCMEKFKELEE